MRFHLIRRTDIKTWQRGLLYLAGTLFSLGIGAVLLIFLGIDPGQYYVDMVTIGMIGNAYPAKCIEGLLKIFVPLLIVSVALALSFKMRFWNVGGEGQFLVGALTAATVAFTCASLPGPILILAMCLAAMLTSGLIGLLTAWFKVRFNTNETLATLMMNYIALYLVSFFGETKADWNFFLNPESDRPIFAKFPQNAWMGSIKIGDLNLMYSAIIAVALAVIIYFYLKKTKQGFEISVVGDSAATAKYAGMNVNKIVLRTMFISAALVGLAGAFTASSSQTISTSITNNAGWTGVIIAWLSKLSIPGIFIASVLISILQYGCQVAASNYTGIDSHFADLLQSIILFSILTADFIANFNVVRIKETGAEESEKKEEVKK